MSKFRHIDSTEEEVDFGHDLIKDIMSKEWRNLWDVDEEMTKVPDFPLDISFIVSIFYSLLTLIKKISTNLPFSRFVLRHAEAGG